jgi:hypothetical protein
MGSPLRRPARTRGVAALAALGALGLFARRRAPAARLRAAAGILAACLALLAAPRPGRAAPYTLAQGDVLIADYDGNRLLRVDHVTGAVEVFSPRDGQANLFDGLTGVVIDPDGAIYATNYYTGQLIAVDAKTGAQSVVRSCILVNLHPSCSDVATGPGPRGIAIAPDQSVLRSTFYVSAEDGVHVITRDATLLGGWGSSLLVDDAGLDPLLAIAYDPTAAEIHVLDGMGGIDAVDPMNPVALVPETGPDAGTHIIGLAARDGFLYYTVQQPTGDLFTCYETPYGVQVWVQAQMTRFNVETGYASHCPGPLALSPDGNTLWFIDLLAIEGRFRVLEMSLPDPLRVASVVADVPQSLPPSWPKGIAVSPVDFAPEPAADAEVAIALLTLAWAARRARTRVARRRSPPGEAGVAAGGSRRRGES